MRMTSIVLVLLLLVPVLGPVAASSQESPEGPLSAEVDREQDAAIAESLERRFRQIESLAGLNVEVDAGVVRISGEVLSAADEEEALSFARRTVGVAEVIDEIDVSRDVRKRIRPALETLEERFQDFVAYLPLLGVALVIVLVFHFLARTVAGWTALFRRFSPNPFVREIASQLVRAAIFVVGLLLALEVLDATALVGAVLGTAGVVGLAVGFAFRDLVENYIASVLLSLRQPFAPNDHVKIDDHEGKVVRLTSRATVLMTLDGNHLRIPNSDVFKGVILNYTRNPLRRFDFGVGVGVDVDLTAAKRLGLEILDEMPGVIADPEPWSVVDELGDSNVLVRFYAWVDQRESSLAKVKSEAIRLVKTAFDDAAIDMPEPIHRVKLEGDVTKAAKKPAEKKPRDTGPREVQEDLSADDHVERQIEAERETTAEEDLLDESAPRE